MAAPKFTPGPWRVDYLVGDDNGDERLAVYSRHYIEEDVLVCAGTATWPLTAEDARLIAAAPEMYEALDRLSSMLGRLASQIQYDSGEEYAAVLRDLDTARAALAKVEG